MQNGSINLQDYPWCLFDRGRRRLCFRDNITTNIGFGHSSSKIAFGPFSSLFLFGKYEKKTQKYNSLTNEAQQTSPFFFFFFFGSSTNGMKMYLKGIVLAWTSRMQVYFVGFSVRAPQSQWRCVWKYKSRDKRTDWKCLSTHMIGVKQIFLWAGWGVLALQFFMKWCPFFLFGSTLYAKYIWSMYPDTVCGCTHWCFELQYIVISIRISTTAEKGYILGKTIIKLNGLFSLPITVSYSLPPTRNRFRQKKDSRKRNDRPKLCEIAFDPIHSWSTAAGSCPPSDFKFSDRPPISIYMTTDRKWLTWNRSIPLPLRRCRPIFGKAASQWKSWLGTMNECFF